LDETTEDRLGASGSGCSEADVLNVGGGSRLRENARSAMTGREFFCITLRLNED
jgi:hypothetical protein